MMHATSFHERLAVELTLTIGGVEHVIPGGAVKHVELDLELYGFTGTIELVLQDDVEHGGGFSDELRPGFLSPALAEVRVSLAPVFDQAEAAASPEPLVLSGLVTRRSLAELQYRGADRPILARRYRFSFADPARVLWTQHFPCRLYTQRSLAQVIDEQLGDKITIRHDWAEVDQTRPLLFIHLPVEHGASFYDFMIWYADRRGGFFTYDYAAPGYVLQADRGGQAEPVGLFGDDIEAIELVVPQTPAHSVEVVNTYAESPRTAAIPQDQAATAVRHDRLMRSSIAQDVDDRVALEKLRLIVPKFEAELSFARMPVVRLQPGLLVELAAANRWSARSELVGVTWRVQRLRLRATAGDAPDDHDLQMPSTTYRVELDARLEQEDDLRPQHPPFRRPRYPGHVEGKVVSEKGEAGQKTYQTYRNDETSLDEYMVKVPAWADQQVSAPFIPSQGSGNVYLPSYRDERVLLAIGLEHARIARLLAWRDGATLSMDVKGEQILLGKSETSNTSINHIYEDDKPVFNVARTSASDTGLIQISEGTLTLRVQEKEQ
jgi:hypothetical protein